MRTPTLNTPFYVPEAAPTDPAQMRGYIENELRKVSAAVAALAAGHIDQINAAPTKPRTGDIVLADGTAWNPGSGAGVYAYYGSAWHFLG